MLVASLAGFPLPLTPLELLWINLVTDGMPALALVTDAADGTLLNRAPRPADAPILGRREWTTIAWTGALQTLVTLSVFVWWLRADGLQMARNMAFSTLVFGELFRAFAARSWDRPFWRASPLSNILLLGIVGVSALAQVGLHHFPFSQKLFDIGAISLRDCLLSVALGLVPLAALELRKVVRAWTTSNTDTNTAKTEP